MIALAPEHDDGLRLWEEIQGQFCGGAILLGNGFSANIWPKFVYGSLFDHAGELTPEDRGVFRCLGDTKNFELVLGGLQIAQIIGKELGTDVSKYSERYETIRHGLEEAIKRVHLTHKVLGQRAREHIADHLKFYEDVYSTNYDLAVYWSIMERKGKGFSDFFGLGQKFSPEIAFRCSSVTRIHYLHGGVHLYKLPSGETRKIKREDPNSLIDLSQLPRTNGEIPLFITEGTSAQKLTEISNSDYLAYCFQRLAYEAKPLVILGHSLSTSDAHIRRVIATHKSRPIAVSIRASNKTQSGSIARAKREICNALDRDDVQFFDPSSHPLAEGWLTAIWQV